MKKIDQIYNWSNKWIIGDGGGVLIGHEQGFHQQGQTSCV